MQAVSLSMVHLDADAFFASVEQAADPRLRGRPTAVGGEKRGIIASASYEARQFGIYTPMPTARARKLCPKLLILPGDYEKYERFSRWMFSYAYDFTPDVEITSIDEGYFDLTHTGKNPIEIASIIRKAIAQALKISVSEGIASNKLVSQIASKLNKPAGFTEVPVGQEISFLHPLPNRWLPGMGPRTAERFNAAGLARVGQIAATPIELLELLIGSAAPQLHRFANGIDERPIICLREPAKSYGQQETFKEDQTDEVFIEATLRHMADRLMAKVRADELSVRTLTVKVRYNDMAEDQCGESLPEPTDLETDIYARVRTLLHRAWKRRVSLRLVSLRLTNLYRARYRGELLLDRPAQQQEARHRLAKVIDELRQVRGQYVLMRGHDFVLREAAGPTRRVCYTQKEKSPTPVQPADPNQGSNRLPVVRPYARAAGVNYRERWQHPPDSVSHQGTKTRRSRGSVLTGIPLAVRSYYSFLNSTLSPAAMVALAQRDELPALALCDQGGLHGAVEFTQAARATGIKPVLGAEISLAGRPLRLYVQNARGYANLCRILSALPPSRTEDQAASQRNCKKGDRSRAGRTMGLTALSETEGLIAVSSDAQWADRFPGRFYLGIASPEDLRRVSGADRLPGVMMVPVHYAVPADRWKFDVVQSIRTLTLLRQAHPEKLSGEYHFRSPPEWREQFRECPEVVERTREIIERCEFELSFGAPQFPVYHPPLGASARQYLRQLVFAGIRHRYPSHRWPAIRSQLETELGIIHEVGYEEYFLVVWSILQECRRRGIDWITRGSAADSLVCYCLGISGVCPVRFDLYFRRFLNKERMALNKLPDIDIDFAHDRKDEVIDLIFEKYGAEHCAVVGGFNTYQARGAVGDVAKVLGVSEYQIRRFTEHFPWGFTPEPQRRTPNTEGPRLSQAPTHEPSLSSLSSTRWGRGGSSAVWRSPSSNGLENPSPSIPLPTGARENCLGSCSWGSSTVKQVPTHEPSLPGGTSYTSPILPNPQEIRNSQSASLQSVPSKHQSISTGQFNKDQVPQEPSRLESLLRASPECRDLPLEEEPFKTALAMAEFLNGFPRYPKMHPCGVVLSRQPMHKLTPTFVSQKGYPTTHFDMDAVEAIGLVKMDILAQGGLAAMRDVKAMLKGEAGPGNRNRTSNIQHSTLNIELGKHRSFDVGRSMLDVRCSSERAASGEVFMNQTQPPSPLGGEGLKGEGCSNPLEEKRASSPQPSHPLHGREGDRHIQPAWENAPINLKSVSSELPAEFPFDDPEVWRMIAMGGARAVHHIESPAMLSLCRMTNVREIHGLIAIVSVIRPGAANEQKKARFTRRYQGLEPPEYPHPSLESCLRSTYGLVVYEEHILQICEAFAGLNPGRADVLRRALVKRNWKVVQEIELEFSACACRRGHTEEKTQEVWGLVTGFNGYAFCKAHSTAYGVEAYQSAWLKRYFPAEFMAAVLTNGKGFYHPLVYVLECHRLGIPLAPPCINEPGPGYQVRRLPKLSRKAATDSVSRATGDVGPYDQSIRVPVTRVKGVTERTKKRILSERARGAFRSLRDFYLRVGSGVDEMEAFIRVGAFDVFGQSRTAQFWEYRQVYRAFGQSSEPGQGWLLPTPGMDRLPEVPLTEPTHPQRLKWEQELLGFAASDHPLALHDAVAWETYCPIARLGEHLGQVIVTCGLVIEQRIHHQVTGEPMKFLTLCDRTGIVETELFAATYKSYGLATVRYPVLEVTARVEPFENGQGHTLRVMRAGKPRTQPKSTTPTTTFPAANVARPPSNG